MKLTKRKRSHYNTARYYSKYWRKRPKTTAFLEKYLSAQLHAMIQTSYRFDWYMWNKLTNWCHVISMERYTCNKIYPIWYEGFVFNQQCPKSPISKYWQGIHYWYICKSRFSSQIIPIIIWICTMYMYQ